MTIHEEVEVPLVVKEQNCCQKISKPLKFLLVFFSIAILAGITVLCAFAIKSS